MIAKPKRRWFRFSLRTLFVLVTVLCVWLGYQVNLVSQRRDFVRMLEQSPVYPTKKGRWAPREWHPYDSVAVAIRMTQLGSKPPQSIPWVRLVLGDETYWELVLPDTYEQAMVDKANKLFPEASIWQLTPDHDRMTAVDVTKHN